MKCPAQAGVCEPHEAQQVSPCSASTSQTELVRAACDLRTSDFQGNAPSGSQAAFTWRGDSVHLQTSSSSSLLTVTCRPILPCLSPSHSLLLPAAPS